MADLFYYRESSNNGWTICPKHELFGVPRIEGSYGVFACRMLGISYPDWIKWCAANGAKLYGKQGHYIVPVWREPNKEFIKKINQCANAVAKQVDVKELSW